MTDKNLKAMVCQIFDLGIDKWFDFEDDFKLLAQRLEDAERKACATVDDKMIDAYIEFASRMSYLQHPDVPYLGTFNGDSESAWQRRVVKAMLEHAIRARGKGEAT